MQAPADENDIRVLQGDIKSLEREIERLNKEKDGYSLQIENIQTRKMDQLHADFPIIDEQEELYNALDDSILQRNSSDVGQSALHSQDKLFDDSINKFFDERAAESESQTQTRKRIRLEHAMESTLKKAYEIVETKENILYENAFRMGGITAFPLNQYLFEGQEILGIRFDIFSSSLSKFVTPHYAIVKKEAIEKKGTESELQWTLYKHTLPIYLPLDLLSVTLQNSDTEKGLQEFAKRTRDLLYKTQYKHDKIDFLERADLKNYGGNKERKIISKIERDIQCQRVKLFVNSSPSVNKLNHELELVCDDESVTNIHISFREIADASDHADVISNYLVGCNFEDLKKQFRKVFHYMVRHNLI